MALNSYTAQKLYENGILDYVPMDLISTPYLGAGMQGMTAMNGQQYLNSAMQGDLYNTYENSYDSFTSTRQTNVNFNSTNIGSKSNAASNALGFFGIGKKSTAGANGFGLGSVGNKSTAGANGFGQQNIGDKSNINFESANGGFTDVRNSLSNTVNTISGTPKFVWGLLSLGIIGITLASLFKGKKETKPSKIKAFFAGFKKGFKSKEPDVQKIEKPSGILARFRKNNTK